MVIFGLSPWLFTVKARLLEMQGDATALHADQTDKVGCMTSCSWVLNMLPALGIQSELQLVSLLQHSAARFQSRHTDAPGTLTARPETCVQPEPLEQLLLCVCCAGTSTSASAWPSMAAMFTLPSHLSVTLVITAAGYSPTKPVTCRWVAPGPPCLDARPAFGKQGRELQLTPQETAAFMSRWAMACCLTP